MPAFLTQIVPQIYTTLLALDISANFLGALPPVLSMCANLEELNVASNPLRVLPVFISHLRSLRVLIADSTGVSGLPEALLDLDKLHTISIRRNKLNSLPSWLCLLPALQTLCIDNNPFQGPWQALVEPLLARDASQISYPTATPTMPSLSTASSTTTHFSASGDGDSDSDDSDPGNASGLYGGDRVFSQEEEDYTMTPERMSRTMDNRQLPPFPEPRGLARTRTTPNRSYYENRLRNGQGTPSPTSPNEGGQHQADDGFAGEREVRRMKSAGELRRGRLAANVMSQAEAGPSRPTLQHYATVALASSSSDLVKSPDRPNAAKRFASLGPANMMNTAGSVPNRPGIAQTVWDNISDNEDEAAISAAPSRISFAAKDSKNVETRKRSGTKSKEKGSRWGFLKKMSMGKMKPDIPDSSDRATPVPVLREQKTMTPQIDVRFSTAGTLDAMLQHALATSPSSSSSAPPPSGLKPSLQELKTVPPPLPVKPSIDAAKTALPPSPTNLSPMSVVSSSLLAPPSSNPKSKRRSFLPFDTPISLSVPGAGVSRSPSPADEDLERGGVTPIAAVDNEALLRREEERAREAYARALRSIMAYLKDLNDLGLSQQPLPANGHTDDSTISRSRRPTIAESPGSPSSLSMCEGHSLRDPMSVARNGQTMSVMTTDSVSSDDRKFKDDKAKRAMIVKEIVVTERTYVKGLEELVDIYINPACAPVTSLGSVSSKDTLIPAQERKIVFGGLGSLFSFHKDSFLPALEKAAAPLMQPEAKLREVDADGSLSLEVARAVGTIFLKQAAFMKMYSTYINNFDTSVQRVKHWTSGSRSAGASAPTSGTNLSGVSAAHLAGLGLSMSAISNPGVVSDGLPSAGAPTLTSAQRKRIRTFLKRCRVHPRHSQLNLEGYLLLPVQRIPRYRLLLEELLRNAPPTYEYMEDPLERALTEISSLANNMNEGKRESESRRRLVQWQSRIRGKFPSPLVQPHRRLIMDGPLLLTRVVRKTMVSFETVNASGDVSTISVDCLSPELTPRPLIGILCNDLLVLCRDPSEGQDPSSSVDLWAVLRMQTLPQPASIVHGNALRLVDNKAILYFDAPSPSDALNWYRAINLHIPASKA
ncbi:hypothetical protein FISHEDRAFT_49199 [Fistulina hepatica ATCC 64428]|uniref:DH domain-containing protein n=1 Tax=Fistulina hepatica ATCC 64428 TaxID=1128425 RepID=A0A0D7A3R7_9AGAR|nr:hypothetical protein FISHEDRAFT_49199 [Fistulina hepatica ATCC 64428]